MIVQHLLEALGPGLASALEKKEFTDLTPVQEAVLDPSLARRDLRITSQTGSGKTVAIGFVLRSLVEKPAKALQGVARPRALVVAPTRELARQLANELTWLYASMGGKVLSVTGGSSTRDERRALATGPAVVVGTPGRLLDHLTRGAIDASQLDTVVLDEADHMLDLGFREELEAILAAVPSEHRTLLVSATFPREVRALADRVQKNPATVEGTPLGLAHADIDHVVHLVHARERIDAIVNLLLANPEEQTLVFARTRLDVADIAAELARAGFATSSLSGDMEQRERNQALAAFRRGDLRVLVATDVAARGIDVQDIARVIQAEPPTDPDSYTHRSGRTARAGRKGTSSLLVAPAALAKTNHLLMRAKVKYRFEPIPTADDIKRCADERLYEDLTRAEPEGHPGFDAHSWELAKRLAEGPEATRTVARLLARIRKAGPAEPREVHPLQPPSAAPVARGGGAARPTGQRPAGPRSFVPFRVSYGQNAGAEPRRVLAMACRRGRIEGTNIGAIRVFRNYSVVEVASDVAEAFATAAAEPDARDKRIVIAREREHAAMQSPRDAKVREGYPRGGSKAGGPLGHAAGPRVWAKPHAKKDAKPAPRFSAK
jgi:ATP-dependent RNA helicase DeaD